MAIVGPLKARITATDNLIDEIVYKLYGLTEEEEKLVKTGFPDPSKRTAGKQVGE